MSPPGRPIGRGPRRRHDISPAFTDELSLAIACCRWPITETSKQLVQDLADKVEDWGRFDLILKRNRITLLAHHALVEAGVEVPPPLGPDLARRARESARRSLTMARESLLLQQSFERAGLPVMVLKGIPVGILAYGKLGFKESCDVDILTSREAVPEAAALLVELGYRNSLAHLGPAQLDDYLRLSKETLFVHSTTRMQVDLHWGITDNRHLLQGVGVAGPAQEVATPVGTLRTIAGDELFSYLCLHGAVHNWGRLKWLADLGALLAPHDEAELRRLREKSRLYGADRAASVALLLLHRLLGRPLGEAFLRELRSDRMTRVLERNVLAGLGYASGTAEHVQYTAPWLRTMMAQFVLAKGSRHAVEHARLMWTSPIDRRETPLPAGLEFLYPVIRIPLWLARKGKSMTKRLQA